MKVIIVGKGASGKDFLKKKLSVKGRLSVSHTTRPPRPNEREGVDYYYVSPEKFKDMVEHGEFLEWNEFGDNKWCYGTSLAEYERSSIFIMTPSGVDSLSKRDRDSAIVIYLDIDEETRLKRLIERRDVDDPRRRMRTDDEDFTNFTDYDIRITNPNF